MIWDQGRDALSRIFTRRNFGVVLLFILFVWLTPDAFNPSPGVLAGLGYRYSVSRWEVSNLPAKWVNIAHGFTRGRRLDRAQRLEVVDEYMEATRLAWRQERRLEGIQASVGGASMREAAGASGSKRPATTSGSIPRAATVSGPWPRRLSRPSWTRC